MALARKVESSMKDTTEVMFTYRNEDAREAGKTLVELVDIPGVVVVDRVFPYDEREDPAIRDLWYARVKNDSLAQVVEELNMTHGVSAVHVPPVRKLV